MVMCVKYFSFFSLFIVPAVCGITMNTFHFISHPERFCSAYNATSAGNFLSKFLCAGACVQKGLQCAGYWYNKASKQCKIYEVKKFTPYKYNGIIYFVTSGSFNHSTANTTCKSIGSYLVVPENVGENAFISSLAIGGIYLGINDTGNPYHFIREVDGLLIQYTQWMAGNPDNYNGLEDCVTMNQPSVPIGKWNDARCSTVLPTVVCQWPAPGISPNTVFDNVSAEKCYVINN